LRQLIVLSAAGVGVVGLWSSPLSVDPGAWVLALAGIAGVGFLGRPKTKPTMDMEE